MMTYYHTPGTRIDFSALAILDLASKYMLVIPNSQNEITWFAFSFLTVRGRPIINS